MKLSTYLLASILLTTAVAAESPESPSPTEKIAPGLLAQIEAEAPASAKAKIPAPVYRIVIDLEPKMAKQAVDPAKAFSDPEAGRIWKENIAALQDRVLKAMAEKSYDSTFELWNRYRSTYGFSAYADSRSVFRLASLGEVARIHEMPVYTKNDVQAHNLTDMDIAHVGGSNGLGVTIAIIDDGIDHDHAAFGGQTAFPNDKILGGHDYADNDTNPRIDCNTQDHGTAVAGIAAGNGGGVTGAAPEANLVFYKVQSANICGAIALDGDIPAAIDRAVTDRDLYDPPIRVISMSLGNASTGYTTPCWSIPEHNALRAARFAGMVTLISSGNSARLNEIEAPSCNPYALSVGAVYDANVAVPRVYLNSNNNPLCTDFTAGADQVICYSNSADILNLLAPSACAVTADGNGNLDLCFEGTSAAAPYAAGVAAVGFSSHPDVSNLGIIEMLRDGTLVTDARNNRQTPRVNSDSLCSTGPFANSETVTYSAKPQSWRVSTTGFWVYYGNTQTNVRRHVGFGQTVQCTNTFFGSDPLPGVQKTCYLFTSTNWMRPMASEWGSFTLPAGRTTRTYNRQNGCPTARPCTNAEFGDPAPYFYKECTLNDQVGSQQADEGGHFSIRWGDHPTLGGTLTCVDNQSGSTRITCTANPTGGRPPYSYQWSYSGSADHWWTSGNLIYASYLSPGCNGSSYNSFGVTITDAAGQSRYVSNFSYGCF
ncbi:MAG: S8 family serine peptidase [Acidobacteriota bacterium]